MSNYIVDTKNKQITFLDNRFYHHENDVYLPSVTTILQAYPKDASYYQWLKNVGDDADTIRDEAGKRGSIVHELTERYDNGEEISLMNDNGYIGYKLGEWSMFERYVDFTNRFSPVVMYSEINIVDPKLGCAGTIDRIINLNGKNIMIDIKTSNAIYDSYWLQLAAYKKLFENNIGKKIDNVAILWLNAKTRTNGKGDAIQGIGWQMVFRDVADEIKDWELFLATQMLWRAQNGDMQPKRMTYTISHKK